MELLPVIYNSLIIAAGLFVITIAISFVSYKVKQKKGTLSEKRTQEQYPTIFRDKKRIEDELKPHSRIRQHKPPPQPRIEKRVEKKEKPIEKIRNRPQPEPKEEHKKDSHSRIERVTALIPTDRKYEQEKKQTPIQKRTVEGSQKKKNLKSIDDDPLKKYTDSADDDLHPLKTEE